MLNKVVGVEILQEIEDDPEKRIDLISNIRNKLGMSIQEAAHFSRVNPRTWHYWEARDRKMPIAVAELFLLKLRKICNREYFPKEGLITVLASDKVTIIDVVSGANFLGLDDTDDSNIKVISSVAVNPITNRPYICRTSFRVDANHHVMKWVN